MECGQHLGEHHQAHTEHGAHDAVVVQGETDSYIVVIGHSHKEEAPQVSKKHEEIHLGQATCIEVGRYLCPHVLQQFRYSYRGKAEVREGQVTEKQTHGCMEMGVQ
jgi:hypothetical protein